MRRLFLLVLLLAGAVVSSGCYVMQDQNGQWWACETYATPNGPATGCYQIQAPF